MFEDNIDANKIQFSEIESPEKSNTGPFCLTDRPTEEKYLHI